ncbi:MAG: flagellar biosynthesis protein FlhF [Bermanella sp.]|jgi:flagellar biosynthesis protein FlhF|uniref:flagellar biosynthesis protein FlhF n=1 Tax=Glaciecola sp. 33A TaxID=2057807 RepID=UPI000C34BF5D|nr:flagellar biosynthesis protein FlhF [Glaciecola sp. 33A]PKH99781.1 flagellar biosynthesis protein FlhF [Glaciecola sp. 33A]
MKIRRFFGKDMREALKQVKDELGGDAVIMSNKKVADGVELVAAVDKETEMTKPAPTISLGRKAKSTPTLSEIIGDDGPDSLKALLEKQHAGKLGEEGSVGFTSVQHANANAAHTQQQNSGSGHSAPAPSQHHPRVSKAYADSQQAEKRLHEAELTHQYVRTPVHKQGDDFPINQDFSDSQASDLFSQENKLPASDGLELIKSELASIRNVLQYQVNGLSDEKNKRKNPTHYFLGNKLLGMGISEKLCAQLISFLPPQASETEGWDYLLNLISNRLHIGGNDILQQSGIVALVGATGTGKTTTVAKLAAKYAQKFGANEVAMITVDTYRIAAFEQLATYGKIIGCTVKKAQTSEELAHILYQLRHKKLVLIDTAGFSQRDARLVTQLNDYEKETTANIKKYLVLPAGAQYQVLHQTIQAYKNINLTGCIFSKLDECYSLGEALSVVIENDLRLSYVTDGQRVPEDIKLADAKNLIMVASKLYKKYALAHTNASSFDAGVRAV